MAMLLILGFALSFIGSVPMTGPLAALVLERSLGGERRSAVEIAAAGSCVEGGIAAGLGAFVPLLLAHSDRLVTITSYLGALVILVVGLTLAARPHWLGQLLTAEHSAASVRAGILATALNPTLVATWTLVTTSLYSLHRLAGGLGQGLVFGLGVALGSLGWFVLIILAVRRLERQGISKYRYKLLRGMGLLLSAAGVLLLVRTLMGS